MIVRWLQRHPGVVNWALVLIALATAGSTAATHDRRALGIVLALLEALPLIVRRRWPLPVLAATTAATIAVGVVWGTYNPFPVAVALFTVADRCERRTAMLAGLGTVAALALPLWSSLGWVGLPVAWLIGDSVGARRGYVSALEERAERLERERAAEAARAVAEEQARIARELHDVVAHSLSVIVVQATAADDIFDADPQRAREAVRTIQHTGRGALDELRRLLANVRSGETPAYAPQPGLAGLEALVAQVRSAGLAVVVSVEGEPRTLPAALDLSAYRIIQEALTNTLKHARASRVDVLLRYRPDELDIEVRDDGVGGDTDESHASGHGLVGMRERLGLFGGSLQAGPTDNGGFAVAARFPLEATV